MKNAEKELILSMLVLLILLFPSFSNGENRIQPRKLVNREIHGFSFDDLKDDMFLETVEPIEIFDNDDLAEYSSSGEGTREHPYIIENFRIEAYWMNPAIEIRFTTAHFVVRNCFIITDAVGILMTDVSPSSSQIVNNTILSRLETGIAIELHTIHNCSINQNLCVRFRQGIKMSYGTFCTIRNNTILYSDQHGIQLYNSRYNTITYNHIENSSQYGVALTAESNYNRIHRNYFINNGLLDEYELNRTNTGQITSQAYDDSEYNTWYDGETRMGNCWSDYKGKGHYQIDGSANSVDQYPSNLHVNPASFDPLAPIMVTFFIGFLLVINKQRKKNSN